MTSISNVVRSLQAMVLTGIIITGTQAEAASDYISLDAYLEMHPEQQPIVNQFADLVRSPAVPITQPLAQPVRIAIIYPGLQASDYWRRSQSSFEQRLHSLGVPFEVKSFFSHPSVETALQSQQLSRALEWKPDYLAFTLNVAPQGQMVERLLAQGTPKLILQNITTPLAGWQSHPPFLYVGFDHAQGTQLMAEWMLNRIDYGGKYLLLYYSPGYVSQMRGDTFAAEAAKYPNIQQVGAFFTDGNQERAYQAARKTLEAHPDLKMIYACSTDVALGALRALREMNRLDVLLNGWGGGDAELMELQQKGLDVTVMRINDDNGIAMAEAIKLDLEGHPQQVPQVFSGDIKLLDSDMTPVQLAHLKQRAFRLSGLPPTAP